MTVKDMPQQKTTDSDATLEIGRTVLLTEAKALSQIANDLDGDFVEAVNLIETIEGRVIITGMGKSGHVGRKIAATMASTGTPAFFVHPGEASHGDLGMIVRGDVVIAISNSGESKELTDLIAYTRRFAIPLIAMTKNRDSLLGREADIVLILPSHAEACPNGLAPTTSTTVTLALGDALAVALLDRKNFTAQDFNTYHPGGKLGQQLMKVKDIMHTGDELPLVSCETPVPEMLKTITAKGFGCTGVVDADGKLVGMITDGDVRRHAGDGFLDKTAADVMTKDPRTIRPNTLAGAAMGIMNNVEGNFRKITALFAVEDDGRPAGLLHLHDCLRAGFA